MYTRLRNLFRTSITIPAQHELSTDLYVSLPEEMSAYTGSEYLNIQERPVTVEEIHRVGLFLMTQFQHMVTLPGKYSALNGKYVRVVNQLDRANTEIIELTQEIHRLNEILHEQDQQRLIDDELADLDRQLGEQS